jgi:hypothetical protein
MRKIVSVLTLVFLATLAFAGGQGGKPSGGGSADSGLSTVKILGIDKEWNSGGGVVGHLSDWYTGKVPSRLWEETKAGLAKYGVQAELDLIAADQIQSVFQTTIASGRESNYDWISLNWNTLDEAAVYNLARTGKMYPINKLIEQYSVGPAKDFYYDKPNGLHFRKLLTMEDGNFYWFTTIGENYYRDPANTEIGAMQLGIIRYDWLQALGKDFPKTLDEFYDTLISFQQNDMNKNGVRDEIAQLDISDFRTGIAQWWGLGVELVSVLDFKAVSPWYQPHVQEYIAYMNKLYKAGLIKIDTEGGAMQANRVGFEWSYMGESWEEPTITVPQGAAKPYFAPFIIQAATDVKPRIFNDAALYFGGTAIVGGFVPAKAKNLKGAAGLIDYVSTQEFIALTEYGIEGYTYNRDSEGRMLYVTPNSNNVGYDQEMKVAGSILTNGAIFPRHMVLPWDDELAEHRKNGYILKADMMENMYANKVYPLILHKNSFMGIPTVQESERALAITPDLTTYSKELLTSLILGEKSLSNWNTYMADLKRLGLDELISITQARLDRGR